MIVVLTVAVVILTIALLANMSATRSHSEVIDDHTKLINGLCDTLFGPKKKRGRPRKIK